MSQPATAPLAKSGSQYRLLRERRFLPFFLTQFFGAFNDNVYKNALIIMIAFHATSLSTLSSGTLVNLCAGLFILPFFLFSATAGQLADKYDKARIIRYVKGFEIGIMAVGAIGFMQQDLVLLVGALFMMGVHSTMFGPVKYSILPQHLRLEELVGGNGLVEMGTFTAILIGTVLGGVLIAQQNSAVLVSIAVIAIACAGYLTSRGVPSAPPAAPDLKINWNPFTETWANLQFTRKIRTVFLSVLGISWFWFYGATLLAQFPNYCKDVLGGNEHVATVMLTTFSIGVGAGSLWCERLSGKKVEIGLVPFGSIGLTLFALDLFFASPSAAPAHQIGAAEFMAHAANWRILFDLLMIGLFGGFYIVPLYALIQTRAERSHQSRVIAGNNILNALFMVVSALMAIVLLHAGLSIPHIFLVTALLNAIVAIYIYSLVPEFLMRFLVWLLMHSIYRLDTSGTENIPEKGAAVLVCNHVSFVDALIITAACRRPVRFVMDHNIFRIPVLNFIFRTGKTIPIASAREDARLLEKAYDDIANALRDGDLVCMFPEGRITDTGEMYPFKSGITRIIERTPVPVVPLALRGLWGSFFSRRGGKAMSNAANLSPFKKISLVAGNGVAPAKVTPEAMQGLVLALRGDFK
ncbi:MAG: putative acyltransferase family protein [Betaproteobacteria bacterium]|nr:putative acyltransferase family protein [Betaproteobacteria bacterium]